MMFFVLFVLLFISSSTNGSMCNELSRQDCVTHPTECRFMYTRCISIASACSSHTMNYCESDNACRLSDSLNCCVPKTDFIPPIAPTMFPTGSPISSPTGSPTSSTVSDVQGDENNSLWWLWLLIACIAFVILVITGVCCYRYKKN